MSVELRPLGVKCNIQCQYCYQNPQRDAGNILHQYDLERMKSGIEAVGGPFTLFGGEPLLLPLPQLEELWSWGYETYGRNSVQTNGSLITADHMNLFERYNVQVGISVDGPGELNDVRWAGSLSRTREATAKTAAAIEMLCAAGRPPSLIVTLHRNNATADKLPQMHDWCRYLEGLGVTSARLHILEVDHELVRQKYALSDAENTAAMLSFAELEKELTYLRFDVFDDLRHLLRGQDENVTCVWNACDPYTTRAVQGVEGNGQASNCGRTNKDGIDFVKADQESYMRYLALYHTPQEFGGCQGCRFFAMCKGQCPGTSISGDWRNRSEHCQVWKDLFTHLETEMVAADEVPLSLDPQRATVEQILIQQWTAGRFASLTGIRQYLDDPTIQQPAGYVNGHGDAHGDHTDLAGAA